MINFVITPCYIIELIFDLALIMGVMLIAIIVVGEFVISKLKEKNKDGLYKKL